MIPVAHNPGAPAGGSTLADVAAYWKMDESSGTRADSVASTNFSTISIQSGSALNGVPGKIVNGAEITNGSQFITPFTYMQAPNTSAISLANLNGWTMAGWLKPVSSVNAQFFWSKSGYTGLDQTGANFRARSFGGYSNGSQAIGDSTSIVAGTWYLVIVWYDGTNLNIQVNNDTPSTTAQVVGTPPGTDTGALTIGNTVGTPPPDTIFDEFGFWRRVLTSGERTALYNAGAGVTYPTFA